MYDLILPPTNHIINITTKFRLNFIIKTSNLFLSYRFDLIFVLNATFSNISAVSWQPVLVVEEAGVPCENHRPWASNR